MLSKRIPLIAFMLTFTIPAGAQEMRPIHIVRSGALGRDRELHLEMLFGNIAVTQQQQARLRAITTDYATRARLLESQFDQGSVPLTPAQVAAVRDLRSQELTEIRAVLTPDQNAQLSSRLEFMNRVTEAHAAAAKQAHTFRDSVKASQR
jgi:Spy/CpxP family protein refolding chaperone